MLKEHREYAIKVLKRKGICHVLISENKKLSKGFSQYNLRAEKLPKKLIKKGYGLSNDKDCYGMKQVLQPFENCIKTYGCTCGGKECK